ncbi:MAG: nucleoside triphosphate pyrophosphohydrolase [Nitrospinae bacterium]|nr:nucleoside triphosphate pyrophosphohydrolase [Nitrospinota bacterium]
MSKNKSGFERAVEVMARLRAPDGCPWDKEQDHQSLKPYLVEEAYEVMEAIEAGDPAMLKEELGDLLLQVLFHCRLAEEKGLFDAEETARALAQKMIDRHPHVFEDTLAETSGEVLRNWEISKRKARAGDENGGASILDGVPATMPALQRAQRLQGKASRVGFDWPDAAGAAEKVEEEWAELKAAMREGDQKALEEEMGDFLFAAVNLSRKLGVNAEGAARACIARFTARFQYIEKALRARGLSPEDVSLEELDALWNEAKNTGSSGN